MILVDTSIWIEFLRGKEPIATEMEQLLDGAQVCTIEAIFGELLQGCKNRPETNRVLAYWRDVPHIETDNLLIAAGQYSSEHGLTTKGLALTDSAILVAAHLKKCNVWTLDKNLLSAVPIGARYKFRPTHGV